LIAHSNCLRQTTLFKRNRNDFLKEVGLEPIHLQQWKEMGLLSFDIDTVPEFDEKEVIEALFIKSLINSGLSLEKVLFMLSKLEKPYCYSFNEIFWDFYKNEWVSIVDLIEKEVEQRIEENLEQVLDEHLDNYLNNLQEEGNREKLNELLKKIKMYQPENRVRKML